jgi:hypothetical protein
VLHATFRAEGKVQRYPQKQAFAGQRKRGHLFGSSGWDKTQHDDFLRQLLDIQAKYIHEIFGATGDNKINLKQRRAFKQIYRNNVADIIMVAAKHLAHDQNEPLSLMFAAHKEISSGNLEARFMDLARDDDRFAECIVGKPKDHPPLQLADLIAYELSHSIGNAIARPSYTRMKESAKISHYTL